MKRNLISLLLGGALAVLASSASAYMLELGIPNTGISGYQGPYADVTITLTSATTADITFTHLNDYWLIDSGAVDLNINGNYSFDNLKYYDPNGIDITPTGIFTGNTGGTGSVDGFGKFNLSLNFQGASGDALSKVTFTLTDIGGTWADENSILINNNHGYLAAAHISVGWNQSGGALATGYAANGNPTPAPEPGSLSLLGLGLIGLSRIQRRRG